jgi:thiol-disulfide isomerase/thioredoxin
MAPARVINGRVTDADGKALAEVYVRATRWAGNDTLGLQAMTNAEGRFALIDAPNDSFELSLYARGFKPLLDQTVARDRDTYTFELTPDPRASGDGPATAGLAVGSDAPELKLTTLDGKTITSADLRGKVVLLDFWATWCGPCVGLIPHMAGIHKTYKSHDDFVMISLSAESDVARVRAMVAAQHMTWNQVAGDASGAPQAFDHFQVTAIPAVFLIDREGKIAAAEVGGASFTDTIEKLLATKSKSPSPPSGAGE